MKSESKIVIGVGIIASLCVMVYLYFENQKLKKENTKINDNNLKLMLSKIDDKISFDERVFMQLTSMIENFRNTKPKIANEIAQAMNLLRIGQIENAIEDLVKIMENILKDYYKFNTSFLKFLDKKNPTFDKHLEFCYKKDNKISEIEYNFYKAIKAVRNAEDHELDLQLPTLLNVSGLLCAIEGIIKLSTFTYQQENTS